MSRNLKRLGLAVVLSLTALACTASIGQAARFAFESGGHKTVKGSATGAFVTQAGGNKLSCKKMTWHQTISTGTIWDSILEETVTYSECTNFGVAVTVNTTGCALNVRAAGEVDISCLTGKTINYKATVLGASCEVQFGAQKGLKTVSFYNEGSGSTREIRQSLNLTGVAYTATGSLCSETGNKTNGTMTGEGLMTATTGESTHVGVWVE